MANKNNKINELVLDDDDPTAELDVTDLRATIAHDASVTPESDVQDQNVDDDGRMVRAESTAESQPDPDRRSETISRLQSDMEQLRAKWLGLDTEINARAEVASNLEKEADELKSDVACKEKLLKKRNKKIRKLGSRISDLQQEHDQLVEEHAATRQQLADKTTAAAEQTEALGHAVRDVEAARSELHSESEKIAGLEADLKARDEAQASLERQLTALTKELADLRSIEADHVAALDTGEIEIQGMQDDLKTAGEKITALETKITEGDAEKMSLDEQRAELQRHVEVQSSTIAEKDVALEATAYELEKTRFELKTFLDQGPPEIVLANISKSDAQEIQAQMERTEKYADTLRHNLSDLTETYSEVVDERDRLRQSLERMTNQNTELSGEIAKANESLAEIQAAIEKQQTEQQATLDQLQADHEREIRNLRFELGEAQETVSETTTMNTQLAAQLLQAREFKEDLESMLSQNDEQAKGHIEKLEKQINRLTQTTEEFEQKLENKSAAIDALLGELAKRSEQIDSIGEIQQVVRNIDDRMSGRLGDESAPDEPMQETDIVLASQDGERASRVMIGNIGDQVLQFPLFKDRLTIGRTSENDIQIKTAFVSRRHAIVLTEGDSTRLVDRGSRNGVFVNSRRVKEHVLSNGDIVTVGDAEFRYEERQKRGT